MNSNLLMQGRGRRMKPNDLVSCQGAGLIDRTFSPTAASPSQQLKQKNGSPGLKQDVSDYISSPRREFRGCEDSPQVVSAWTSHCSRHRKPLCFCVMASQG